MIQFGEHENDFYLKPNCTFVNHGSYGTAPKKVLDHRIKLIKEMEEQPDIWFRENWNNNIKENLESISLFVESKFENLVFVPNATTGLNCIFRSLHFSKGDAILIHTWTYMAIKNLVHFIADQQNLKVIYVKIPFPINSSDEIVTAYEDTLSRHSEIKIIILDHICSMPPVLMPLEKLIAVCRRHNKMVAVDGAHAPGQLPLHLERLDADFYTGNLHKWLFAPRGNAILWVSPKYHNQIFPSTISTYTPENTLHENFGYQGTMDITNYLTTKTAIQFYQDAGGYETINKYCTNLISNAEKYLIKKWGVENQQIIPTDMLAPNMRFVPLPHIFNYPLTKTDDQRKTVRDMAKLMSDVWHKFHVQSIFVSFEGKAWVRISANIYNKMQDFENLADSILNINTP